MKEVKNEWRTCWADIFLKIVCTLLFIFFHSNHREERFCEHPEKGFNNVSFPVQNRSPRWVKKILCFFSYSQTSFSVTSIINISKRFLNIFLIWLHKIHECITDGCFETLKLQISSWPVPSSELPQYLQTENTPGGLRSSSFHHHVAKIPFPYDRPRRLKTWGIRRRSRKEKESCTCSGQRFPEEGPGWETGRWRDRCETDWMAQERWAWSFPSPESCWRELSGPPRLCTHRKDLGWQRSQSLMVRKKQRKV